MLGGEFCGALSGDPYRGVELRLSSCTLRLFDGGSEMGSPAVGSISDMADCCVCLCEELLTSPVSFQLQKPVAVYEYLCRVGQFQSNRSIGWMRQ